MIRNNHTLARRQTRYIRTSALLVFAAAIAALITLLAWSDRAYGFDQELDKLNRFVQSSSTSDAAAKVFREGRDYLSKEEWKNAERSFSEFISSYPSDRNIDAALFWLAASLERQGRLREADQTLERLIKEHPQSSWVLDAKTKRMELAPRLNNRKEIESGLNEEEEEIKLAALQSLFDSRPERGLKLALEIIKPDSGASSRMKEGAITLIADHGGPQATPALIEAARGSDPGLRRRAVQMLGSIEDDRAIDFLIELVSKSSERETAFQAINSIGDHERARARTALLQIARSNPDPELRKHAIMRIGDRDDEASTDELLRLFESEKSPDIRRSIIAALSNSDSPRARARILEIARTSDDPEVRRKAIDAIGEREDEAAVEALIQMYDAEKDESLKEKIIDALGDTERKRALGKLMDIVRSNTSARLKKRAISVLGQSDDPEASRFLEDLLKKNN